MDGKLAKIQSARSAVIVAVLICGIALSHSSPVRAEDISIDPMSWDYGYVGVGTSLSKTFTLESNGPSAVWTYVIYLTGSKNDGDFYTGTAFSIVSVSDPLPIEMPEGKDLFVNVAFNPPSSNVFDAYLYVFSNDSIDPPGMYAFIPLRGNGVDAAVPEPSTFLLFGTGLTGLAGWRLRKRKFSIVRCSRWTGS